MKISEEIFHPHPKKGPPRYDLRKRKHLPDPDLDQEDPDLNQEDPDLVKSSQHITKELLIALLADEFNELTQREFKKRDLILNEIPTPNPEELKSN